MNKLKSIALVGFVSATLWSAGPALAAPEGGSVTSGTATIDQTIPNITSIRQLTDKAIIDWRKFNINSNELVKFVQPSEMAVILNRVTGGSPSVIMGKLQANGQLFLVNPNGILFGQGAQVDVGSLVATTLSISNQDFLNGNYHFTQDPSFDLASVVNQGEIHVTDGGYVVLTAPLVSNEGLIVANLGKVALGAGGEMSINLDGRDLVNFQLGQAPSEGGTVVLTPDAVSNVLGQVVNQGELGAASSLVEVNGEVRLVGGEGLLLQAGTIQAGQGSVQLDSSQLTVVDAQSVTSTVGQQGGSVKVSGPRTRVSGLVDASGVQAGGNVALGSRERTASTLVTAQGDVRADAVESGQGGTIVVWADQETTMAGTLSATSPEAGKGGFVETSSGHDLNLTGEIKLGDGGEWLIDPVNMAIVASITGPNQVTNSSINGQLNSGVSVTVNANGAGVEDGDITLTAGAPITKTSGGTATLTLDAGDARGYVFLNDAITSVSGALNVVFETGSTIGSTYLNAGSSVDTNGGSFTSTGAGTFYNRDGGVFTNGGSATINHGGYVDIGSLQTGSGSVSINTSGNVVVYSLVSSGNVSISAGGRIDERTDTATDITANNLTLTSGTGIGSLGGGDGYLDVTVTTNLTASVSGTGEIQVNSPTSNLRVVSATTADGDIRLTSGGNLRGDTLTAGGSHDIAVTTTSGTGHDVLIGDWHADGNAITINSGADINDLNIFDVADLFADSANLQADGAIGNADRVETSLNTLTLGASDAINVFENYDSVTVTHAGSLDDDVTLGAQGGLILLSASTLGGTVTASAAGGDLRVDSINAPDIALTTTGTSNDILVGDLHAGNTITLTASGAVEDQNISGLADLYADNVFITAAERIGSTADPIEIEADGLTATVTGNGELVIAETLDSLNAPLVSSGGSLKLSAAGALSVTTATAAAGSIQLSAAGGNLSVESATANSGNVSLQTTRSGDNILFGNIYANTITMNSAGSIQELNILGDPDLVGASATLTAAGNIGSTDIIETDLGTLSVTSTGAGFITLREMGSVTLTHASSNGNINIQADTALDAQQASAGGWLHLTAGNNLSIGAVTSLVEATLTAGGQLNDAPGDLGIDVTAPVISMNGELGVFLDVSSPSFSASALLGQVSVENFATVDSTATNVSGVEVNLVQNGGHTLTVNNASALSSVNLTNYGAT